VKLPDVNPDALSIPFRIQDQLRTTVRSKAGSFQFLLGFKIRLCWRGCLEDIGILLSIPFRIQEQSSTTLRTPSWILSIPFRIQVPAVRLEECCGRKLSIPFRIQDSSLLCGVLGLSRLSIPFRIQVYIGRWRFRVGRYRFQFLLGFKLCLCFCAGLLY